ncbi:MAG: hypothetical protein C0168_01750 [Candidatus Aminicenantes bacterium]|nr:MAG: hypothetical protein C0168_01750 [Candidatus Aminicenantes bacterium]
MIGRKKRHILGKRLITTIFVVFIFVSIARPESITPTNRWLRGYERSIEGEKILYHSPYPGSLPALLVRATNGLMRAEWQTEKVPENNNRQKLTFVFLGGLASQKGAHHFYLTVDGHSTLTFRTYRQSPPKGWTISHPDGLTLTFKVASVDQFGDLFGYFYLEVPGRLLHPGQPLHLSLTAEKAGSDDWVMIFEHQLTSWAKLKTLPAIHNSKPPGQLLLLEISHFNPPEEVSIQVENKVFKHKLQTGYNQLYSEVPPTTSSKEIKATIKKGNQVLFYMTTEQHPVKPIEIWLLPHSHLDIGYSDYQTVVEKKHWANYEKAIELAEKSQSNPPEARFKWNIEQLWPVETYLKQASPEKKEKFIEAVKKGWIELQATLGNELTGLCHPEELLELTSFSRKLQKEGIPAITSAMITDIPSYSWSFVPALAQAGVKYLSSGPNYMPTLPDSGDRIGWALKTWGDRPFYWVSPSGEEKILFWMAGRGYSWFHGLNLGNLSTEKKREILEYVEELEKKNYPYSLIQVRYTVGGDNGPTDPELTQKVKSWNEEFLSPKMVIATCQELFQEMEKRHGSEIPALRGDFSPYWEDGAGSTARETAANRNLSEQLIQLETLFALTSPSLFPAKDFYEAWRQVVLFDEHTWGAADSISNPDGENAVSQWEYKKAFLTKAQNLASKLEKTLKDYLKNQRQVSSAAGNQYPVIDLFNTGSWKRTGVVYLPAELSAGLDQAVDERGQFLNSQRLADGSLAVEVTDLPPFSAQRIQLRPGQAQVRGSVLTSPDFLENDFLKIKIDPATGAVNSLIYKKFGNLELVDSKKFSGLNSYVYVPGTDPAKAQPARLIKASVIDRGPLVATLSLELEAPGSQKMETEIRLTSLEARIDFINKLHKKKVREKESGHFAFPFNLPQAEVKLDLGWGLANPFFEEIPGACLDFFSIQKAVYLLKPEFSLIWVSPDVPLVEIGQLTDERRINGYPRTWKKELAPSTTLISYAFNNYWHTNYKADQEGNIIFRYSVILEPGFDLSLAKRKSLEVSQPLIALASESSRPTVSSSFQVIPEKIIVTRFKPSTDGQGFILRLFNLSGQPEEVFLQGPWLTGKRIYFSNLKEEKLQPAAFPLKILPAAIVTLRIE